MNKLPLLFLLIIVSVTGVSFVLVSHINSHLGVPLSDTASFTDSIAALLLSSLLPTTAEAISFTDNVVAGFTIVSIPSPTGGGNIPITASNGSLTNINSSTPPSLPPLPPNAVAVNFPHGVISFTANTTPNQMVTLTIQYPSLPPLSNNQYYTYYKLVATGLRLVTIRVIQMVTLYYLLIQIQLPCI